jgi:Flp pilus assembly protein TadD
MKRSEELDKRLSRYGGNWDAMARWDGPIDEPGLLNEVALSLSRRSSYRQAGQQLLRISNLTPTNVNARVGLATMCLQARMPDLALGYVADVRASEKHLHSGDREALTQTEAWAYTYKKELPIAEKILQEAQAKYPLSDMPYATLAEIYVRLGRITNAMEVLDKELKAQPENSSVLNNCARLKIINNQFDAAIELLDHALRLDPKNLTSVMNRSISNLKSGKLDAAQRDYQTLETSLPSVPYQVHYGLFDIAYKKKNPKTALKYGELYVKAAPQGTLEFKDVSDRIKNIKSGAF